MVIKKEVDFISFLMALSMMDYFIKIFHTVLAVLNMKMVYNLKDNGKKVCNMVQEKRFIVNLKDKGNGKWDNLLDGSEIFCCYLFYLILQKYQNAFNYINNYII